MLSKCHKTRLSKRNAGTSRRDATHRRYFRNIQALGDLFEPQTLRRPCKWSSPKHLLRRWETSVTKEVARAGCQRHRPARTQPRQASHLSHGHVEARLARRDKRGLGPRVRPPSALQGLRLCDESSYDEEFQAYVLSGRFSSEELCREGSVFKLRCIYPVYYIFVGVSDRTKTSRKPRYFLAFIPGEPCLAPAGGILEFIY